MDGCVALDSGARAVYGSNVEGRADAGIKSSDAERACDWDETGIEPEC